MLRSLRGRDQFCRGYRAAERAFAAGAVLNPNRWVGRSSSFREGFESSWANLEFLAEYESGETEFLPPMYGLCPDCGWPLEADASRRCRKCAGSVGRKPAHQAMLCRIVRSARDRCGLRQRG